MKKSALQIALLAAFVFILTAATSGSSINRWVYYPFDTNYKAVPDSGSSSWYTLNFDDSAWPPAVANQDVEQFPNLLPQNHSSAKSYFRGELNFTYRDIAAENITAVYVWMWANTGFDLWFNGTYIGGEHAWPTGPPMVFDVGSLFNMHGKNIVAIRSEVLASTGSCVHGTVIIEYSMPTSSVAPLQGPQPMPMLDGNSPNPFTSGTAVSYRVDRTDSVVLTIYNALGQVVRTLPQGQVTPGEHTAVWDGRDNDGNRVGSGTYFYELTVGQRSEAKKAVLLR